MRNPFRLACLLLATACSSNAAGVGGDAGGVGGGVGALAAQGSASLSLGSPSSVGDTCPNSHTINIPYDASKLGPTTTASSKPAPAIDGVNGATVTCNVKQNGANFEVSGTLDSPSNGATVEISVVIAAGQENVAGAVTVTDGANRMEIDNRYTPSACVFSVKAGTGENLAIAPGRVWGKVTCTNLGQASGIGSACNLSSGFFSLESCGQ
jgi:hypothetical protein